MAISEDAKRRWRERRIGSVDVGSPRGIAALILIALSLVAVLATPFLLLVQWVAGDAPQPNRDFTRADLVVNLAFNVIVLILLPLLAIAITHPGEPGAVVRRLRLQVRPITAIHAVVGAVVTIAALFGLGAVLSFLDDAGLYSADESALVPQIQALLNWPLVISISVLAAMTEEIFFRGVLQPRFGILASSVFFAVIHAGYGTVLQVVAPLLLGLLFGYLFQRTRSLWTPIVAHFAFDFVELSILLLQKQGHLPSGA